MQRLFRLSLLTAMLCLLTFSKALSDQVFVSGRIAPGDVRVFVKDSTYIINKDYVVGGTLIIEPGTRVYFHPNGRLIDSTGGRIIADGLASASHNVGVINPTLGSTYPDQYADLDYFLNSSVISVGTDRDITVDPTKYKYTFYVLLDKQQRKIVDIVDPWNNYPAELGEVSGNSNLVVLSYERALLFMNSRLYQNPDDSDPNFKGEPWQRIKGENPNVEAERIQFIGQPVNNFSREWGHIVILPGAKAAFFRHVSFEGFRKDITVDREPFYRNSLPDANWSMLNDKLNMLTNGAGGALTTFSSRTWLIDAQFRNNMARLRGGALSILQAPKGFPELSNPSILDSYDVDKNPNVTNIDGTPSDIITNNEIPLIDRLDESGAEPFAQFGAMGDWYRQGHDDGRLAVYLGRVRQLTFDGNFVQHANVGADTLSQNPLEIVIRDLTNQPADYPNPYGNHALGGAVYISGDTDKPLLPIEIGLGINNSIKIGQSVRNFDDFDTLRVLGNYARNYQNSSGTEGSRGGAIYVGDYTSLIVAGEFNGNETSAPYFEGELRGINTGSFSMGGAIYMENTTGRLQVRGGPTREIFSNQTRFTENTSGSGGAIFVSGNSSEYPSPVIGGSDSLMRTRDYGFDIVFENNSAISYGGAILTKRNMSVNGSGGWVNDAVLGYGGKYPVRFNNNSAGFAGGAIMVDVPNANPPLPAIKRSVHFIRAYFEGNEVGMNVDGESRNHIRGGGAVYSINGDVNVVKGVQFINNKVMNGNGAALSIVHPLTSSKRYFVSDLDNIRFDSNGLPTDYDSYNSVFTYDTNDSADVRMLTRFIGNEALVDADVLAAQSGSGTTQVKEGTPLVTDDLFATWWTSPSTGYVVGRNGTIVRLSSGGATWTRQESGTRYRLVDVEFVNPSTGFAVGQLGTILKTTNSGGAWNMVSSPVNNNINDVFFTGTNIGFAVTDGGYIIKTVDGGDTWTVADQPVNNDLNGCFFVSSNVGYAVGNNGIILKTEDGGDNWEEQVLGGLTTNLNTVFFRTGDVGYAAGDAGRIIKTENGGDTWEFVNTEVEYDLHTIYFSGQNIGFIAGMFGEVLKTENGGDDWSLIESGTSWSFYGSFFFSETGGALVGDYGLVYATNDGGNSWTKVEPADKADVDVVRFHPQTNLVENGIGLGGAIYVLDEVSDARIGREDSVWFNRVRIQNNMAYTGSALYSDNYDLKLIFNRSLIHGNMVDETNRIGYEQNLITGPVVSDGSGVVLNSASSDLVGATIYGEIQGPLPSAMFSEAANSIYNNDARFLIRLPDAPNTKGVLAGGSGEGFGGTDTLRGNYWGLTEGNIDFEIDEEQHAGLQTAINETFFVESNNPIYVNNNQSWMQFIFPNTTDPRNRGPIESTWRYDYQTIPLANVSGDQTQPAANSIPEVLLFSGHVYDIYDKGTDIKTADYSKRRMSPIEDFAVGIPPRITTYQVEDLPSFGKTVKRYTRNPEAAEATNGGQLVYPELAALQSEFFPDEDGNEYHPIGYPLYLESIVDYNGLAERSNHDETMVNQTVYFVINRNTGDFVRINMDQVDENAPNREIFRGTVELVPDSTVRNPLDRRTTEGLLNTASGGAELLRDLYRDPYFEDGAALPGRRYHADVTQLGGFPTDGLFYNRGESDTPPTGDLDMPESNFTAGNGFSNTSFWAGERWRALPVNVNDTVSVVSRTVLWREGVDSAFAKGMTFRISESTEPPVFTGNIPQNDTSIIRRLVPSEVPGREFDTLEIEDFQNRIFVTEGRLYPAFPGTYSEPLPQFAEMEYAGRDSIIAVTAVDFNRFYDPRALNAPTEFSYLTYGWDFENPDGGQAALDRWLFVERVPAQSANPESPFYLADGYLLMRGQPLNPFVVPGGETVTVSAANFPPNITTVDSMKTIPLDDDLIAQFVETYPSYMHAREYDFDPANPTNNARYFQQDSINVGFNRTRTHEFEVFVVDSAPYFIDFETAPNSTVITYGDIWPNHPNAADTYVEYFATQYQCNVTNDGRVIANVTDKLRFQIDMNTDDEWEDKSPAANGWDFRFGRTSYGFVNSARYNDQDDIFGEEIEQVKPEWMQDDFIMEYDTDNTVDPLQVDFTTHGQLNVRVPFNNLLQYVTPSPQVNDYLISDTVVAVVVNDGHGGINSQYVPIFINYQPVITNESLPTAIEGIDYNPGLNVDSARIFVTDPNFEQTHTFELVYSDDPRTTLSTDPCFPDDAPQIPIEDLKTTPDWVQINRENGIIYGTPSVTDAPQNIVTISVIVTDENGLRNWKQFDIEVEKRDHTPEISGVPSNECIDVDETLNTEVRVYDLDLVRTNEVEELTIEVLDSEGNPAIGVTANPSFISGPAENADTTVTLTLDGSLLEPDEDQFDNFGRKRLIIRVTDKAGNVEDLVYFIQVSAETDFTASVFVENSEGAIEELIFGTAPNLDVNNVTSTGDGVDGNDVGQLDYWLCEFELPPTPTDDVFDARWDIPLRNGTLRNLFPTAQERTNIDHQYKARFKAGGEIEGSSRFYPVNIFWMPSEIPALDDTDANPTAASWYIRDANSIGNVFSSNMKTPNEETRAAAGLIQHGWRDIDQTMYQITVLSQEVKGFVIVHDWVTSVNQQTGLATETRINSVNPNPVSESTVVRFEILKASNVKLEVVDLLGNVVTTLVDDYMTQGLYDVDWDGTDMNGSELSSGNYQLRLVAGDAVANYNVVIAR